MGNSYIASTWGARLGVKLGPGNAGARVSEALSLRPRQRERRTTVHEVQRHDGNGTRSRVALMARRLANLDLSDSLHLRHMCLTSGEPEMDVLTLQFDQEPDQCC
jgi:hypothetical protein